jgi:hypothetical protein
VPEVRVAPLFGRLVATALVAALASARRTAAALARGGAVVWVAPTKSDNTRLSLKAGSKLTLRLTATTSIPEAAVSIASVGLLPRGAALDSSPSGGVAHALFQWTPAEAGEYTLRFRASTGHGASAPIRTYLIDVETNVHAPLVHYPQSTTLTGSRVAHWARVIRRVAVLAQPRVSGRVVTTLGLATPDGAQTLVLVLAQVERSATEKWYRVRLPILPNNSTGWVPSTALGNLETVHTHLYVDRARLTATLMRNGHAIFKAIVGVGRDYWPTPKGEFYIRTRASRFHSPFYGPVAFATSARSAVLTDWPGGGFVGVHGTDQPELLPGRVSHGCIRMRNGDIVKLARLMPVGTPLTIR